MEIYVTKDELRTRFALGMSEMYKAEVPLYGDLVEIVKGINTKVLQDTLKNDSVGNYSGNVERLSLERHGAIRLGTPFELRTVARIFELLGMRAHGYYDLSIAGLPMHGTCFRPTSIKSLEANPFRVFTTLLRPELLVSDEARTLSSSLLAGRCIFSDELLDIIAAADTLNGNLTEKQAGKFIKEALRTFSWQPVATSTLRQYDLLKAEHPILADISCFSTAHINHLTPRTLDIAAAQEAMRKRGMAVKPTIEGPPQRVCPILLRQTSFLALEEAVNFHEISSGADSGLIHSSHKARFGEIEQRGAAVTRKGRDLYDGLLRESRNTTNKAGMSVEETEDRFRAVFEQFPDLWEELRAQGLIYCHYELLKPLQHLPEHATLEPSLLEQLIIDGYVKPTPITYEDFLPLSAAGIFQSNLQGSKAEGIVHISGTPCCGQADLEKHMERKIIDLDDWYSQVQKESLMKVATALGLEAEALL